MSEETVFGRIWGGMASAVADPKAGPHHEQLEDAQRAAILSRVNVLVWISVIVMPTTILSYVAVVAPERLFSATVIVGLAVVGVLAHRFAVGRGLFDVHYHLAMVLLVAGIFGPTGAAIIEVTRLADASFLFAYFLIYFAFTALFPADPRWVLATCILLIASFVGVRFGRLEGVQLDADLAINVLYLLQLSFIGLILNQVVVNLFFAERTASIELSAANEELLQLDRVKTSFFSSVSHELRTPLTLILTPVKQLLGRPVLDRQTHDKLSGAHAAGTRLLKMVNQLLDFAKIEAGQAKVVPRRVSLHDLTHYAGDLFRPAAEERGLELVVRAPDSKLRAIQDLDKLEQILVNLLGNALKFTPRGGVVTLECRAATDHFDLVVSDTGVGIAPEAQAKIFDRFAQVKVDHTTGVRGTGIGLSMVREYAHLLSGEVSLVSEPSVGSAFTVRLPLRVAGDVQETTPEHRARRTEDIALADLHRFERSSDRTVQKAGPKALWVLIVDDNPALVSLVSSILQDRFNLHLAYDAEEGLDVLERAPHVDMVISDVMMPGISGLEFCKRIKEDPRTQLVPVILLTARGATEGKIDGLKHGADDYIGKPFDPHELVARVDQLFELRRVTLEIERKSAELEVAHRQLQEEEVKLIASEKLRTMGDLAAGIFHELHNYLNMIHNGAVPLKDLVKMIASGESTPDDVDETMELADLVLEAADHAMTVTGELKGYAHTDAGLHRVVDLHRVLQSNLRMFGKIPGTLTVDMKLAKGNLPVSCAPTHLVQVFTNLMKNAFEAMESQGTVTMTTRRENGVAVVRVADTGPGVSPDFADRLFEPFQSTKKQGVGLGLGLSMARKVVEEHGGSLSLDDAYREGACFVVRLPIAPNDGGRAQL